MDLKQKFVNIMKQAMFERDFTPTYWQTVLVNAGIRWALVVSWMDYDNDGNWKLYAKLAYQPTNAMLQCDYDVDWLMPYDNEGVDDTELSLGTDYIPTTIEDAAEWFVSEWVRFEKEYVGKEELLAA